MFISLATLLLATFSVGNTTMTKENVYMSSTHITSTQIGNFYYDSDLTHLYEDDDDYDYYLESNNEKIKMFNLHYYNDSVNGPRLVFTNYQESNFIYNFYVEEYEGSGFEVLSYDSDEGDLKNIYSFVENYSMVFDVDKYLDFSTYEYIRVGFYVECFDEYIYNRLIGTDYNAGFTAGYKQGFDNGNNSGFSTGYNQGKDLGYSNGYSDGYDEGYAYGYQVGYNNGSSEVPLNINFLSLLGAIADTPVLVIRNLYSFDLFGVSALTVFMSILTALIIIHFVRRFL